MKESETKLLRARTREINSKKSAARSKIARAGRKSKDKQAAGDGD